MKIKQKTSLIILLISLIFATLCFFILHQMRELEEKIDKTIVITRVRENVLELRRLEQDYMRAQLPATANNVQFMINRILVIIKSPSSSKLILPQSLVEDVTRLTKDFEVVFKELLASKKQIEAEEEKLNEQGQRLEKAVSEAFEELKASNKKSHDDLLAQKLDKITLANKVLTEGYGFAQLNAAPQRESMGKIYQAILNLKRGMERDALTEAASGYIILFNKRDQLQQKMKETFEKLHEISQTLESVSSKPLREMNRKRGETQSSVMLTIFTAFAVCGILVFSLSLWFGGILTGPILKLRRAMLQIGRGNLDVAVDVHLPDEVGELAESFRTMARKLKESYEALHQSNNHLAEQARQLVRSNEALDRYSQELDKANNGLKKMDELKSRFIATASHELKTPLTSVKGYVEMVLQGEAGPINAEQKEFLGYVKESADRLHRLVRELLNISNIESGQVQMAQNETDLHEVIKSETMLFRVQAEKKQIEIVTEVAPDLKNIRCDSDRIREVLDNLLSNAIKCTPPHGNIRVFAANNESGIQMGVQDNGRGIKPGDLERIFEPFQHIDVNGYQADDDSSGLGLTLVKRIVEAHGGRIEVRSDEGKGAVFIVMLPREMKQTKLNEMIGRDL